MHANVSERVRFLEECVSIHESTRTHMYHNTCRIGYTNRLTHTYTHTVTYAHTWYRVSPPPDLSPFLRVMFKRSRFLAQQTLELSTACCLPNPTLAVLLLFVPPMPFCAPLCHEMQEGDGKYIAVPHTADPPLSALPAPCPYRSGRLRVLTLPYSLTNNRFLPCQQHGVHVLRHSLRRHEHTAKLLRCCLSSTPGVAAEPSGAPPAGGAALHPAYRT